MIFLKLYRFFMGKIRISAQGVYVERLLNLCAHNGITVWGIKNREGKIVLWMLARDFFRLRPVIRGNDIRVHILKKRGWPFIFCRYRHRYGLFAGVVFFIVSLQLLSGFVWNIGISGNCNISDREILDACKEIGVFEGARTGKLDEQKLRLVLMSKVEGLAWAAINVEGCTVTIDVTEAEERESESTTPCNIVAAKSGIIRKIEVTDGKKVVKVDDFVAEGDLLVSGVMEYKDGSSAFVHSAGEIIAEVEEIYTVTVPLKQEIEVLSENVSRCYAISIFGLKIPLYFGDFKDDFISSNEKIMLKNSKNYLPIYFHKTGFKEIKKEFITLTEERAADIAREELDSRLKDVKIINKSEKIVQNQDSVSVICELITQRDIAKEEILLFGTTN
ncbi:MAG: sporulation protein YqfD [Clostridia bacterium]|nr:sporulation protein YqfD [Clostridia bacterium]